MKRLLGLWDEFWFSRFDPLNTAFFRISLGALMFIMFICSYFNWDRFYASDGLISLNEVSTIPGYIGGDKISIFYLTEGKIPVIFYWYIAIIFSFFFMIGFLTRISTIVLYVLIVSLIHRNYMIVNGDDLVMRMVLFHSCFFPLGYSLSVDNLIKNKIFKIKEKPPLPMVWPMRILQINIALIYAISLPYKLVSDVYWLTGEALYLTAASDLWGRFPFPMIFCVYDCLLSKIMTYGTILVEGTFPLLVWFKETCLWVTIPLMLLHVGIAIFIPHVLFFTLAMVCAFWVFIPSEIIRKFFNPVSK